MFPASFGYVAAHSVGEALELLTQHGEDAKLLAGGHSLIPAMKLRLASPRTLIDLGTVPGLRGVHTDGNTLVIGALTVHTDVASAELVQKHLPGLADAASVIGDVQVRNRGTIGGSIAHADPGADFPVILTALNASFVLQSTSGSRTVAADDFFIDFYTTAMAANEVLTEIRVPLPPAGSGTAYAKLPASGFRLRGRERRRFNHPAGLRLMRFGPRRTRRIGQRSDKGRGYGDGAARKSADAGSDRRGCSQGGRRHGPGGRHLRQRGIQAPCSDRVCAASDRSGSETGDELRPCS